MAKAKKTPAPAEPVAPTPLEAAVVEPKPASYELPPPVSGPRKNQPSGGKRLVHNGVVIDMPDTVKRKATMTYDGTSAEVECPKDMDLETFRVYLERAADEMMQILTERNRRSKTSKAAERILVEARASIANVPGGELGARLLEQKSLDIANAQRRASEAAAMLAVQDALIDDAKRRWMNAE